MKSIAFDTKSVANADTKSKEITENQYEIARK